MGFLRDYLRQIKAFLYRRSVFSYHYAFSSISLLSRYIIQAISISYIGIAYLKGQEEVYSLIMGILLWGYLSTVLVEIGNSIEQEQFEGTLENTFSLPCKRWIHLISLGIIGVVKGVFETSLCYFFIKILTPLPFLEVEVSQLVTLIALSTLCFFSLSVMVGSLALLSKVGNRIINLIQGPILLISGVYFPVETLPEFLRTISPYSPATYIFSATRDIINGASLDFITLEFKVIGLIVLVLLPLSFFVFSKAEEVAKKHGLL